MQEDHGGRLAYVESKNFDFPKMFAKIGGKSWKGGEIAETLSKYFSLQDFGLNAGKTYGKKEDKPLWWSRRLKWKKFRCPSKAGKDECTAMIRLLLEHCGIDPSIHYEEEGVMNSSSESDGEQVDGGDALDLNANGNTQAREQVEDEIVAQEPEERFDEEEIRVQEVDERREGEERMEREEEERIRNDREREKKRRRNYVLLSKVTRSRSKRAGNM